MNSIRSLSESVVQKLEGFDYDTFLVGASVPHTILDNEDELRSRFKIKGRDSIKSQITKMLSERIRLQTGKSVNYAKPDITILASMSDQQITLNLRSIWFSGRYVKLHRGFPQRSSACPICNGLGCAKCEYKGRSTDSVQSKIAELLTTTFGAEGCNFVWLGSEDENSLVRAPGRPFYVEVTKPKKRFALSNKKTSVKGAVLKSQNIQVRELRQLDNRVTEVPQFEITAALYLKKKDGAPALDVSQVTSMEKDFSKVLVSVRLSRKFRTVRKEIRKLEFDSREEGNEVEMKIQCDGGIPLKKFVSGQDDSVQPNLGRFLASYEIDREKPFDILKVKVKNVGSSPGGMDINRESGTLETSM